MCSAIILFQLVCLARERGQASFGELWHCRYAIRVFCSRHCCRIESVRRKWTTEIRIPILAIVFLYFFAALMTIALFGSSTDGGHDSSARVWCLLCDSHGSIRNHTSGSVWNAVYSLFVVQSEWITCASRKSSSNATVHAKRWLCRHDTSRELFVFLLRSFGCFCNNNHNLIESTCTALECDRFAGPPSLTSEIAWHQR